MSPVRMTGRYCGAMIVSSLQENLATLPKLCASSFLMMLVESIRSEVKASEDLVRKMLIFPSKQKKKGIGNDEME